jgi:hypothetical protein
MAKELDGNNRILDKKIKNAKQKLERELQK